MIRFFLDAITNRTIEINLGEIQDYKANYSQYLSQRAERRALQQASAENQAEKIKELEGFVDRFRYKASKAKQAQSRLKMLDKMVRIEIEDDDTSTIRFRFPDPPRSGAFVVDAKDVHKNFDAKKVLKGFDFEMERTDKVAFIGKNGEGKSTFSRILAGVDTLSSGVIIKYGHNVKIGYYAQNQADSLQSDRTVFQTIDDAATGEMRTKVRSLLGAFLFGGDAVEKKVKVLSGGEKSRLAMARLLLEPVNLLILDEPTNHLDMRSKDVLKEALINYTGAMIVVSHDRDFLSGLTNKVIEFKGGKIRTFIGDVYDYLKEHKLEQLSELDKSKRAAKEERRITDSKSSATTNTAPEPAAVALNTKQEFEEKKQREKEQRRIERQLNEVEKEHYASRKGKSPRQSRRWS